ncbi:MAG: phosphoadenylyl-sulfate reductase [Woeseia sp.]
MSVSACQKQAVSSAESGTEYCEEFGPQATRVASGEFCNRKFAGMSAAERVRWSLEHLPANHVISSSFGAQSAVMLHLLTQEMPDVPVVVVDTGYLFPETYQFIDAMQARLNLNLHIYRAPVSPAWQEARHGERWLQGRAGIEAYNNEVKVEPMKRALRDLAVGTWFAGLRRSQSSSRTEQAFIEWAGERVKVHPIADWTDRDVYQYLQAHDLPYHPLWEKGYVSIGDHHTTRPLGEAGSEEATRFFGLKRECGLHEIDLNSV